MRRYWAIYRKYVMSSIARDLEFRTDFVAKVLQSTTWVFFFYVMIEVIYANTESVAGWNRAESVVLSSTTMVISGINHLLFMGLWEFPEHIRKGSLDFAVTKPVDAMMTVFTRKFSFHYIGQLAASIGLLVYGIVISGVSLSLVGVLSFLSLVVCANVVFLAIMSVTMTTAIYFVRVDNIWVLPYTILDVARFPTDIFNPAVKRVLTFVFPMAFLGTVPTAVLLKGAGLEFVGYGVVASVVSIVVARWFWTFSLRRYSSASS